MKRFVLALIAAAMLIAPTAAPAAAPPFVIGVIAPTTGPVATVGAKQLETIQWWAADLNGRGGINGREVRIISCDDAADPEKAVACGRDLLGRGIVMLLNCSVTGPIRATMPLVEKGPVMLTPSPNVIPDAGTFVFQTSPSDLYLTQSIAAYLKANHIARLAMIAATDASGEVGVANANTVFPKDGITLNLARIDLRANDAMSQLTSVTHSDVKIIYSNYSGGGAAAVIKSFANLGLTQPLIVSYANISDSFINLIKSDMPPRLLGTALKGVAPALITDPASKARLQRFVTAFKKAKNEDVDMLNLTAVSLVDCVEAVLRNVKNPNDPSAVRAYLERNTIPSFQAIRFSSTSHVGIGADGVAIVEYKNGAWVPAAPTP